MLNAEVDWCRLSHFSLASVSWVAYSGFRDEWIANLVQVIAYYFDYGMSFVPGSVAWRVPIACQVFFAFVSSGMPYSIRQEHN